MKAKVKATGEIVEIYHESQHGQTEIIYKEAFFVNGRIWTENELEFLQDKSPRKAKIGGTLKSMLDNMDEYKLAKTREEMEKSVNEGLEEASKEWIRPQLDKSYEPYGENKMMELTHFDGYAMLEAIEFGMKLQREQMMEQAIDGVARPDDCEVWCNLDSLNLKDGDKVKIVIVKSE